MSVLAVARIQDIMRVALAILMTVAIVVPVGLALRYVPNRPLVHIDKPLHSSMKDLAADSDLIVYGPLAPVVGRQIDYGSAAGQTDGIPMAFHQVAITETLKGPVYGTVVVAVPDQEERAFAGHSPERKRIQDMLLFPPEETVAIVSGVPPLDRMYTP